MVTKNSQENSILVAQAPKAEFDCYRAADFMYMMITMIIIITYCCRAANGDAGHVQEGRRLQVSHYCLDIYYNHFLHNLFFNELSEFGRNQSTPPTSLQTVSGKKTYGFGTAILFALFQLI